MYADVIIDISHEQLDKTFQYAVPDELADVIELGMSVDIPFGAGNRQITGYVVSLGDKAEYPVEKIKYYRDYRGKGHCSKQNVKACGLAEA